MQIMKAVCLKYQSLFSGKDVINLLSAEFAQSVVRNISPCLIGQISA